MSQPSPSTFLPPWLLGGIGRRLPQASADFLLLFSCGQPTPYPYLVTPLPLLLVSSLLALILFFTAPPPILPVSCQNTGASQDHASDHVPLFSPFLCPQGQNCFLAHWRSCTSLRKPQAEPRLPLSSLLLFPPKCVEVLVLPI